MNDTKILEVAKMRDRCVSGEARRYREAARLTASEVALAVRVHPATVRSWEDGTNSPTGAAALRYAAFLEKLAAYLAAGPSPHPPPGGGESSPEPQGGES